MFLPKLNVRKIISGFKYLEVSLNKVFFKIVLPKFHKAHAHKQTCLGIEYQDQSNATVLLREFAYNAAW